MSSHFHHSYTFPTCSVFFVFFYHPKLWFSLKYLLCHFPFPLLTAFPWNHCSSVCPLYLRLLSCFIAMSSIPLHTPTSFSPETLSLRNQTGRSSHFRSCSWGLEEGRIWDSGPCSLQVSYVLYDYICSSNVKILLIFSMFFQFLKLRMPNLLLCYYSY